MGFFRHRQYRSSQEVRDTNADVSLSRHQFVSPVFIVESTEHGGQVEGFDGVCHFSPDNAVQEVGRLVNNGITKILLFGVPENNHKDETASFAWKESNFLSNAITQIKKQFPELVVITDVCMCSFTNHGHCGILNGQEIDNDASLPVLARIALSHAKAGADIVAPSAMMDGQVQAIRELLDAEGYNRTKILAYSAKYSSSFYGPFRNAASSAPSFGNRTTYQMDYRTITQGISEAQADIDQGADWVMVKPAHTYLDMIYRIKTAYPKVPMVAYHVSGEIMMIKALAEKGLCNYDAALLEATYAMARAGADYIITYDAPNIINLIKNQA